MDIKEALGQLDTLNDDQWTSEGMPKVDVVSALVGSTVTRQQIIDSAPKFSRQNTDLDAEEEEGTEEEVQSVEIDEDLIADFLKAEPKTVQEFLEFLKDVPAEQLLELEEGLREQQSQLNKSRTTLEEFDGRVRQALSFTKARIKRDVPDMSDAEANRAYLRSQAEARAEKAALSQALLKGVDVSALDPRAPIDRAFARKTGRGGQRPTGK